MWLNYSSIPKQFPSRLYSFLHLSKQPPLKLSEEEEDALYAIFLQCCDERKECNLAKLLRNISESDLLTFLLKNKAGIVDELNSKLSGSECASSCVNWANFLLLVDQKTSIARISKSSTQSREKLFQTRSAELIDRHNYSRRLQSQGLEDYAEISNSSSLNVFSSFSLENVSYDEQYKKASDRIREWDHSYGVSESKADATYRRVQAMMNTKSKKVSFPTFKLFDNGTDAMEISTSQSEEEDRIQQLVFARLAPLSVEETKAVEDLLLYSSPEKLIIDKFNTSLKGKDLCTLRDGTWLNDEVINFYMQLLQQRNEAQCGQNKKKLPSYFLNSFFLTKLLDGTGIYTYANVRRWTKKFDVFSADKIFFPINVSNTHWTLAVVHMHDQRIQYYDSMGGKGTKYLDALLRWVQDEHEDKKAKLGSGGQFDATRWRRVGTIQATTPQQRNGVDCGVFCILFADFLSDNLDLSSFQQKDISMFRRKVAHFIVNGELSYPL